MNSYNYSYNVLINRLEAFAAGHFLIKRFTHGQIDMADQLQDDQYPFMHVTPDTIEPAPGAMNFGFHIMFADIPRDKEYKAEYQREVISDCIRLGQDLIAEVKNGLELFGFDVQLLDTPIFEPFIEEQKNTVTGIAFTIKLSVPWDWSACDIPAIWSTGGTSGSGGSATGYGIELQTNGVDNIVQTKLNLVEGTNITITDLGNGSVTIDAAGGTVDYVSTAFNANHTTATGNQYVIGDRVWYNGSVYQCIANNDGINPTNTSYWSLVAVGYRLRQTPVDWNATSGDFQVLNKPTIPAAQVNSDWNSVSGVSQILNKPTIPAAQVNSDWNAVSGVAQILNKPTLATVATTGSYTDLINQPTIPAAQIQSDWTQANTGALDYIKNKPTITTPVNSDWNAISGLAQILNKPFVPSTLDSLTDVNAPTPTNGQVLTYNTSTGQWVASTPSGGGSGTVTSVGITMPAAFSVSGSPVTTSGTLAVTGAGTTAQYVRGDGTLATFPTLPPTIGDMLKSVYDTDNDGIVDFAESMKTEVRNSTGAPLYKGHIVYLSGSTGNLPNAVYAQANNDANSAQTFGVVYADIANNSNGFVITLGQINTLDTRPTATNPFTSDTLVDGDVVYLSPTTPGHITNVKPSAPQHIVYVGMVVRTSPTNGTIQYRIQNGYELDELHNVVATAPANNDYMYYDASTSLYRLRQLTAALITDSTSVGQNILKLANPSAVRYLKINADNTVTARTAAEMVSDLGITSGSTSLLFQSQNASNTPASSTYYGALYSGSPSLVSADTVRRTPMPTAGTLTKLYVQTSSAQPATGSLVCTVRKNSVDQALTLTIAAGSAAGVFTDLVNSVSVAAGDLMGMKFQNNATTVSANVLSNQVILSI